MQRSTIWSSVAVVSVCACLCCCLDSHALAQSKAESAAADSSTSLPADAAKLQANLMTDIRQLTFEGRRAGEGYFSKDGRQMVFQSEREPGNPFFQIYLMDRESGDVHRVSPGKGKTTCAWISPAGDKVLYASTQYDAHSEASRPPNMNFGIRRINHGIAGIMIRSMTWSSSTSRPKNIANNQCRRLRC